jgi:hypothetical protein
MSGFALDLRHALRSLLSTPGFAAIAILTLALGLGLGTTAFSLIDGILLQPMPYPRADRLVLIKATVPPDGHETNEITYPDGIDLAAMSQAFERMAALMPFAGTTTMTEPPSRVEGFEVSTSVLSVLGLTPTMGRDGTSIASLPLLSAHHPRIGRFLRGLEGGQLAGIAYASRRR